MAKKAVMYENAVVISDLHYPFHDTKAIKLTLKIIKAYQPDIIFIAGDLVDCFPISKFSTNPTRMLTDAEIMELSQISLRTHEDVALKTALQREFDMAFDFLSELRKGNPKASIYFIDGNHEYRLSKYLFDNGAELYGITKARLPREPVLAIPSILRFDELSIQHVSSGLKESYFRWGKMLIGHFNMVRKHSAYTAKGLLDDKRMNLIQAHTHRLGTHYHTGFDHKVMAGYENGCLCDLEPQYCVIPNWQHGFTVIHKSKKSNMFHVQQVHIIKYTAFFGDREWTIDENTKTNSK